MPTQQEINAETLRSFGYDPAKYTIDDAGNIVGKPFDPASSTPTQSTKALKEQWSATQVGLATATEAVAPTAIGAAAAGVASKSVLPWVTKALGVAAGPWGKVASVVGPPTVGAAATYLGGRIEDKALEVVAPEVRQRLREQQQQQPNAALVGNIAGALPSFGVKGSLQVTKTAAGSLLKPLGLRAGVSQALSPVEKAALANVTISTGVGTGMELASQYRSGEKIDPLKALAIGGAQGVFLNQPRRWLSRFGMEPIPVGGTSITDTPDIARTTLAKRFPTLEESYIQSQIESYKQPSGIETYKGKEYSKILQAEKARQEKAAIEKQKAEELRAKKLEEDKKLLDSVVIGERDRIIQEAAAAQAKKVEDARLLESVIAGERNRIIEETAAKEAALRKQQQEAENLIGTGTTKQVPEKTQLSYVEQVTKDAADRKTVAQAQTEAFLAEKQAQLAAQKQSREMEIQHAKDMIATEKEAARIEAEIAAARQQPPVRNIQAIEGTQPPVVPEKPVVLSETTGLAESDAAMRKRIAKRYNQKEEFDPIQKRQEEELAKRKLQTMPTKRFLDWIQRYLYNIRGLQSKLDPRLMEKAEIGNRTPTGNLDAPYTPEVGQEVSLSPQKATLASVFHEPSHGAIDMYLNSTAQKDRNYAENYLRALSETKEFKDYLGRVAPGETVSGKNLVVEPTPGYRRANPHLDEFLASSVGHDMVDRFILDHPGLKSAAKDILASIQFRLGTASKDQLVRIFGNRIAYDAPVYTGERIPVGAGTLDRRQDDPRFEEMRRAVAESKPPQTQEEFRLGGMTKEGAKINTRTVDEIARQTEMEAMRPDAVRRADPLPIIGPEVDKIAKIEGETGKYVAPRLRQMGDEAVHLFGKYASRWNDALEPLTKEERLDLTEKMYAARDSKTQLDESTLSNAQYDAYKTIRDLYTESHAEQTADGPNIMMMDRDSGKYVSRAPKDDPNYIHHTISDEVIEALTKGGAEADSLRNDFIKWKMSTEGMTAEEAQKILAAMQKQKTGARNPEFNAVRLAEASGLPPSWRETDILKSGNRYWRRWAQDMAFYRNVQKDPQMRQALDITSDGKKPIAPKGTQFEDGTPVMDISGQEPVKAIFRQVTNDYPIREATLTAAGRLVKAGMIQTPAGIRDAVTSPFLAMESLNPTEFPLIAKAYGSVKEGILAGKREGVIRNNQIALEDIGSSSKTRMLDELSNLVNKVTGREALEKFSRGHLMALGKLVAEARLNKGDTSFMERFGKKGWESQAPEEAIDYAAARFVESIQGTYDWRGLPAYMSEGQLAPFFSLAKWSIERTNNFNRNVIEPAREGNLKPLLMSVLGGILGGEAVDQVNQAINNKKPEHYTMQEFMQTGGHDAAYRYAALTAYAGYAGIVSDLAKSAMDIKQGTDPRGLRFPLVGFAADFVKRVQQAVEAGEKGEKFPDLALGFIRQAAKDNIQNYRLAENQMGDTKERERKAKMRDLRAFERVEEGKIQTQQDANPFIGTQEREFKRSTDFQEAGGLLRDLIQKGLDQSRDKSGAFDYYKFARYMKGLKHNQYRTMPSPEESPKSFYDYRNWVEKTQGKEAADALVKDFFSRNFINKEKAKMVPSL